MSESPLPPSRPEVGSEPASELHLSADAQPDTSVAGSLGAGGAQSLARLPQRHRAERVDGQLLDLIARATSHDGHPPFSDGSLVELRSGERRAVWLDDVAIALVADNEAEFVVDPTARRKGHGRELLHRLLTEAPADLLIWSHGAHPGALALAAHFGLQPVRQLLQLRLTLAEVANFAHPSDETWAELATSRKITHGMTGHEDAWLELNAQAFAAHPEQGRVSRADLDALMGEEWFEDGDVLLLWDGGALIGYCWMKRETESVGEFYVVGVDPARQGEGLGRTLVAAGLDHLTARGIPIAHLYVEGDNTAAVRLYRSFGFRDYALDIQYRWRSEPDEPLAGGNTSR